MNNIRIVIFIFFCIFCTNYLFSEQLNNYSLLKINEISVGKEAGMLGWQPAIAGGFSGPTALAIDQKNLIYIPDRVNSRINVYDININYVKTIIESGEQNAHFTQILKVDSKGNLYYSFADLGLIKIDSNGNRIYKIDPINLPNQIKLQHNFFPLNDETFFYNDQEKIEAILFDGSILKTKKALENLTILSDEKRKNEDNTLNSYKLPNEKRNILDTLAQDPSLLITNDEFYSSIFEQNKEYFKKINKVREFIKDQKAKVQKKGNIGEIDLTDYSLNFIGYDKEHNSYWFASNDESPNLKKYSIIIFSKYGELLDAFYYGQYVADAKGNWFPSFDKYPTTDSVIAVSPFGDVYFLTGSKNKYTVYKVEKKW